MNDLMKLEESVVASLRSLYHKYSYSQFKMSKFEPYDLYMQNKEFLVSAGVITFTDTDGTLMALKPDVTLSIVKNYRNDNSIQKVCYSENVYRTAGTGRNYREIMQSGIECLGDVSLYEISEVLTLAAKSLRIISEKYVLDLSHMGIVDEILAGLSIDDNELSSVLNYIGARNTDGLIDLLGLDRASKLIELLQINGNISDSLPCLRKITDSPLVKDLEILCEVFELSGLAEHVNLDFSIISDSNYYNGFVFRGYVEGIPTTVLSGGQYDKLMEKMNKQAKGIGFAVYLDQIELLDRRNNDYDVNTVLLYDDSCDIVRLSMYASEFSGNGVLLCKSIPQHIRYRKLVKFENGRLNTIEDNG